MPKKRCKCADATAAKRALGTRRPIIMLDQPNRRWSLDFASDAFTDGRRFRVLTVVDDHTDVPPPFRTIFGWNFPVMIPDREMESSDEGIEVF